MGAPPVPIVASEVKTGKLSRSKCGLSLRIVCAYECPQFSIRFQIAKLKGGPGGAHHIAWTLQGVGG